MDKALRSGADGLILDLEDSVEAVNKPAARERVALFLTHRSSATNVLVRINAIDSDFLAEDLSMVASARPDGIVLPKAEGAVSVRKITGRLAALNAPSFPLLPIATETPRAIFRLAEYEHVTNDLLALTWGAEDLPAYIGAKGSRLSNGALRPPYEMVRALTLFAAHAAGVDAIETVYPDFRDLEGLRAYADRGAFDGFAGMMAIHPTQVPVINACFTPSSAEIEDAHRVIDAFAAGVGVVNLDGKMLDAPHLKSAHRLLARIASPKKN